MSIACLPVGILGLGLVIFVADPQEELAGPADLPFSQGQTFDTLDAYLAHLERLGTMGITWYQRRPDATYEMVRRRTPGTPTTILTRQDLLERFGYTE